MRKVQTGRDAAGGSHGPPPRWSAADPQMSGPAALLEAAALTEAGLKPSKRKNRAPGEDGSAAGKRRRASKADAGDQDREQDDGPSPKSRFLGVHWNKCKKKWRVRIKIAGRDTHVGYYAEEAEAALAFDRAIQKHNPDWQKDPSAALNFPERAGEDLDSPGRWGAAFAQWASVDPILSRSHTGIVTPDCVGGVWSSPFMGGEGGTPGKAKITPFHAKLMVASHHHQPIPSRSSQPGGIHMHGSGWDGEGASEAHASGLASSAQGRGKGKASKHLDLRGLAEAASAHASLCSSPMLLVPMAPGLGLGLKKEDAGDKYSPERPQGSDETAAAQRPCFVATPLSTCSTPAMTGTSHVKNGKDEAMQAPPTLCKGIELDAIRGLVALADASAQCSRSGPSSTESVSSFATPPPPSSFRLLWGDSEHANFAGKGKKSRPPLSYSSTKANSAASASSSVATGAAWANILESSCSSSRSAGQLSSTAFKRIAKPQNQRQQQQPPEDHDFLAMMMHSHGMGSTHTTSGGANSTDGGGSRRAAFPPSKGARAGSAGSKLNQSFRGVTWDKMKKMWRVRVCLAGGGREHVGYYLDEKEGALAYLRAVERIKQGTYVSSSNKDLNPKDMKVSASGLAAAEQAAAACANLGILLNH